MCWLYRSTLITACLASTQVSKPSTRDAFLKHCRVARKPLSKRLVVLDVGANNGEWTALLMKSCSTAMGEEIVPAAMTELNVSLHSFMFEPNSLLGASIAQVQQLGSSLIPPWSTTHVSKAVWTTGNRSIDLWVSNASITSSLHRRNADRFKRSVGSAQKETVTTIELGSFLHEHVSRRDISFMKLDIECVEWVVVPHLFETGAFCLLDIIRVEWHFKSKCPGINISMFHDFEPRLTRECTGSRVHQNVHSSLSRAPIYDFETDLPGGR